MTYVTVHYEDLPGRMIDASLTIEGFGPRTILGAVEDMMQPDGSLSFEGKKIKEIRISNNDPFKGVGHGS